MTTSQNRAEPPKKLEILLAEDNMVNRVLAQKLLQKNGHNVILAKNGKEAVALWEANRLRQFDAILMDIQMPIMDGLQTAAYIRARERALHAESPAPDGRELHIPIVAMTAHAMKGDRERYLAGGMDGYISRPINSVELEQVIQSALARSSPRVSSPVVAPENVNSVTSRGIEEARILARLDGGGNCDVF
jgi:two-component system sensor histidine kinase/response regulator